MAVDTNTFVVNEATNRVGIGTTTPQYTLQINDGTSSLGFVVNNAGSVTVSRITVSDLGTATAGYLSIGTITASAGLHGTTTIHIPASMKVGGTVTAAAFAGDGTGLTGITVGNNTVTSGMIVDNQYQIGVFGQADVFGIRAIFFTSIAN